jgi:hypothetical protein
MEWLCGLLCGALLTGVGIYLWVVRYFSKEMM